MGRKRTNERTSVLPEQAAFLTSLTVKKGAYGKFDMVAFAYVDDCAGKTCKIFPLCPYEKVKSELTKCRIMLDYMREIGRMLHERYGHELSVNADKLQKVGLHLLPLYRILVKLQIDEIATQYPTYSTDRGLKKVDPVYKEIRETLKSISSVFRDLDLSPPPATVTASSDDVLLSGREGKGAYSSLFGDYDGSIRKGGGTTGEGSPKVDSTTKPSSTNKPKLFVPEQKRDHNED